jgi:hypothetical protein
VTVVAQVCSRLPPVSLPALQLLASVSAHPECRKQLTEAGTNPEILALFVTLLLFVTLFNSSAVCDFIVLTRASNAGWCCRGSAIRRHRPHSKRR